MNARSLFTVLLLCFALAGMGQNNTSGFNYQAVVRNAAGDPLASQAIGVRVQIHPTGSNGYTERHTVTTDAHGQIKLVMGEGTPEVGSTVPTFAGLDWTNGAVMNYDVFVDITGGTTYVALATGQFKSVPFALRSLTSGSGSAVGWSLTGNNLSNTNSGNVGIGTVSPAVPLEISKSVGGHLLHLNNTSGENGIAGIRYFSNGIFKGQNGYIGTTNQLGFGGNGTYLIGSYNGANMRFDVSPGEFTAPRMTISAATGYVGIGTESPAEKLNVDGHILVNGPGGWNDVTDEAILKLGDAFQVIKSKYGYGVTIGSFQATDGIVLRQVTGNVGIGTSTPGCRLDVIGGIRATGSHGTHGQGAHLEWNKSGWEGETWLLNQKGGGTGGMRFGEVDANDARTEHMRIDPYGNVAIGTSTPLSKLTVNGKITCKEVDVTLAGFPDYVFENDYQLMPLAEVDAYIQANGHLPNVPSACEVEENGIGLGEFNKILLEKVEELTLHLIEKEMELKQLRADMDALLGR